MAAVVTERLPARTLLYQVVSSETALPESEAAFHLHPIFHPGSRTCEYTLHRAVLMVRCEEVPCEATLRGLGCDGWRSMDGSHISLLEPACLLNLIDDDKQHGRAQALLPDMFFRRSLQAQ